jgi:CxxC motif-containing protein (DUF1111 family)
LIFAPVGWRVLSWQEDQPAQANPEDVRAGEVLFTHEWEQGDSLSAGDGLGPVYNATSCAACHRQGGLGGAGGLEHNVTTFVMEGTHGGNRREGVIHAYAVEPQYRETLALLDPNLPAVSRPSLKQLLVLPEGPQEAPRRGEALSIPNNIHLAQRNTPALFGDGLIDSIPDRVILANAKWQRLRHGLAPGDTSSIPVGRPNRLADGRIGKFGWKAQAAGLSDFVQAACANELGLGNPGHPQPKPLGQPDYQTVGFDLTQQQCDQLTAFVASLPQPAEQPPDDPDQQKGARRGKQLFRKIGCAGCHTPDLGSVSGIYSDLLLHRMGVDLQSGGSSYGGQRPPVRSTETQAGNGPRPEEWRTPPLWGVADSAPYLHDGRAPTLADAIRLHGGQAAGSARRFARLPARRREDLITFLKTLRAPPARNR